MLITSRSLKSLKNQWGGDSLTDEVSLYATGVLDFLVMLKSATNSSVLYSRKLLKMASLSSSNSSSAMPLISFGIAKRIPDNAEADTPQLTNAE